MIKGVLKTIQQNSMFQKGDKVIVAVSGGPDSMCLLHLLYTLKEQLGIRVAAAHLNHCLRGKEADLDEKYVKSFCDDFNIECHSIRVDVHKLSLEKNISCEMAGREARYNFFQKLMYDINAQKIALAHNANDQAETVLMRIIRGTGIEGLVGIKPVRDEIYVRPILNINRAEIEKYCEENKLNPRIDKTNNENVFTRNKIRLELIPYIEKNFNKDVIKTINRLADTVKIDNEYIEKLVQDKYEKYCSAAQGKVTISKEAFIEHHAVISRIIRKALMSLTGSLYNYEKVHIYDIIDIQKHQTGKKVMLPNNILASNNYGEIMLSYKENILVNEEDREYVLKINEKNTIEEETASFELKIINNDKYIDFKKNNFTKYFDYDKINGDVLFRFRKDGDRIVPLGMKGRSKKLKKIFIDLKIPKEKRNNIPIICFGDYIAWVVGYVVSDKFKVDKETKNVLEIKFERED